MLVPAEFEPPVALVLAAAPVDVGGMVSLGPLVMEAPLPPLLLVLMVVAPLVEGVVDVLVPFTVVLPHSTDGAMVADVDTVPEGVIVPTVA